MKKFLFAALIITVAFGFLAIGDIGDNRAAAGEKTGSEKKLRPRSNEALAALQAGKQFDFSRLDDTHKFIAARLDTSDFHLQSLIRIIYAHADALPPAELGRIKKTFLNFKYWMDQPGRDSMCFWSENHQILFAAAEYLAGQYWPDEVFVNSGKKGAEHRDMARKRILIWLEQRWLYGFTEWYSNVYYVEDIAPLANLIDFARDKEIVDKATIVMDLLLHDLATQSHRGVFISTSGRMYEGNKKSNDGNSMRSVIEHLWGKGAFGYKTSPHEGMDLNFIVCRNYKVPDVIKAIGLDEGPSIIKASTGLNVSELQGEELLGRNNRQIMMQWAMEAFSNPEVIENSLAYIKKNDMFSNTFVQGFKLVDTEALRKPGALSKLSKTLNPMTNGSAIQRANTYTYRTPDYMIATAQAYHPGTCGDQQHIWTATLSEEVSLFTTHPSKPLSIGGSRGNSPGYWVGNGRIPHSVQHENIVMNLYRIPEKPTFLEKEVLDFTHAYFPADKLEDVKIDGRYAFARHRRTLVAFIGRYPLSYAEGSRDDLIQPGRDSYWIFEASTMAKEGGMEAFMKRIRGNAIDYKDNALQYNSGGNSLRVMFGGIFLVNGGVVDTEYPRFDSPYAKCPRKPRTIRIAHGGHELTLDFYGRKRENSLLRKAK
ncbi:MAG: hypothetical protein JXM70_04980 [Pirellulales bacterium]|nr:hypothetical protein [Pirellulales bacterium]